MSASHSWFAIHALVSHSWTADAQFLRITLATTEVRVKEIESKVMLYPQKGRLPCAVAHYIGAELNVSPLQVGLTATRMGIKGEQCQLGLFGYAPKGRSAARICTPMDRVPPELEQAIRKAMVDGRVPCAALWQIGEEMGFSRLEMGNAVEALKIKVGPCQLGFF